MATGTDESHLCQPFPQFSEVQALFEVSRHNYLPGGVSWSAQAGVYYLHRVDKARYRTVRQRFLDVN